MKNYFVCLLLLGLSFSCSDKDDKPATPAKSAKEYLTGSSSSGSVSNRKYLFESGEIRVQGSSIDIGNSRRPCELDNVLTLNSDLSYTLTEGATSCSESSQGLLISNKFSITENPKTISINELTFANYTVTNALVTITEINDKGFKGDATFTFQGVTLPGKLSFKSIN